MTCKIVTIVGARPQFIKAAAVSREILKHPGKVEEVMVHTGQHYDPNMSQVFFDELEIPAPKYNLEVSGGSHGAMTGRMLEGIEQILLNEKPDWVLIYGDTNSTLAGALAAAKLHIQVAHVEAGLRSFNMRMPEEVNRILADRVSTLLLCPTEVAVGNLAREGVVNGVHNVGDVMYDVALYYRERAKAQSKILQTHGLREKGFALATCHRAENTDDPARLEGIVSALAEIAVEIPVILPLHPCTPAPPHPHPQASAAVWAGASSRRPDRRRPSAIPGHGCSGTGRKSDSHRLWWCSERGVFLSGSLHHDA
jgi:UDP-GlcNAc3NAcA epimerase